MRMANRTTYTDHALVFAKEWADVQRYGATLGQPLQSNNLGQREYARLIKAAGVRPIKFHGLRHTCATLLLQAGQPVHVVAERLGHKKVEMTLNIYAHVLPDMQQDAARSLAGTSHHVGRVQRSLNRLVAIPTSRDGLRATVRAELLRELRTRLRRVVDHVPVQAHLRNIVVGRHR